MSATQLMVVDAGNTHVVVGIFEGERLVASWRLATREQASDELRASLASLLHLDGLDPADISAVVLASVVPPLTGTLKRGLSRLVDREVLVVGPGVRTGMPLLYDHPDEIGADRVANAIAAHARVGGAAVVVDFGTATTFDCISTRGEYLGGVIAPGLGVSAEALFRSAARLPRVEISRPASVIGKTTVAAMQSGLYHGYIGLVDRLLEKVLEEMPADTELLATGGLAELIVDGSKHLKTVLPNLTLDGLRIIHERNV